MPWCHYKWNVFTRSGHTGLHSCFFRLCASCNPLIFFDEAACDYIFTHDSIGVDEDGPRHQPVEHLASLRAMPDLDVIRPSDANELSVMWKLIRGLSDRPVALVFCRQAMPTLDRSKYAPG